MYKERSPAEKKNAGGIIEILPAASFAPTGAGFVGLWTAIENIRQDFSGVWGTPQQAERISLSIACKSFVSVLLAENQLSVSASAGFTDGNSIPKLLYRSRECNSVLMNAHELR